MKLRLTIITGLIIILISGSSTLFASQPADTDAIPTVVSTDWLAEHLDDLELIILHVGGKGSYEETHIPGAISASLRKMIRVNESGIRDEMLESKDIIKNLSELGIDDKSRVVIYFANESAAWAVARYLLTLEYVGMTGRVAYLNGGLPKWIAENRAVSNELASIKTTDFKATVDPDIVVNSKWLNSRLKRQGFAIIDGRPAEEYNGLSGHWDRLGHIPGAGSIPFFTLLSEEPPYLLKSRQELSDMFEQAGVNPGDTIVVYCGTGLWASLPYLAARYLEYDVRLYDGSFQEWSSLKNLPIATQIKSE
jgi:thiosulfate/3-mercaptopyruvate sulfurtransferase